MTTEQTPDVKQYNRIKLVVSLTGTAVSFLLLLLMLFTGFTVTVESYCYSVSTHSYLALILFSAILGIINSVVSFPFSLYSGFLLEHQYRMSNQTFLQWLWENFKGMLVSIPIMLPLLLIFYFFLSELKTLWWLPAGVTLFIFSIGLSRIAPTFILPLFYQLTPLENSALKEKILALTKATKMTVQGIFVFNLSKTTKKANAAFTGIGKSKRILLGDTLVDSFSPDEIETVFAHELGHYVHGHIWKNILAGTLSIFLGLYLTSEAYSASLSWFGFSSESQLAALPLLLLWLGVYSIVTSPAGNILSRKYEFEADRYAIHTTKNKEAFISTMNKLAAMNLADTQPHPLVEFLFYSHPSIEKRIIAAENL
ncbi:MAG: M48 family metallopeptidase [Bacteroidetes bacterium]|nr:M48 family metallopeptidase [Bacteroidota bacterium]